MTIAEPGQGFGEVDNPLSVAVDQSSGDFYVADYNNFRIVKFDSDGEFLLAFGFGVADGATAELQSCGPAATPPTVRCFGPNFSFNHDAGNISPTSVAVDQVSHDVYVADSPMVTRFTPSGEFVFLAGGDVILNGAAGTGTVTSGSASVTSVVTTAKVFKVGQRIEGTGIEAGTTIGSVSAGTIKLSQPAGPAATGAGTVLSVAAGANNVPSNEVQTVSLGVNTTGGTFSLTYSTPTPSASSATASEIPAPATAVEVEEKLKALANVGAGNVVVSGPAGGPWAVEFKGARYADTDVRQLTPNPVGLEVNGTPVTSENRNTLCPGTSCLSVTSAKGGEVCAVPAECQASTSGTGPGEFASPGSLAFDAAGRLWIGDNERLQALDSDGAFLAEVPLPPGAQSSALAIDPASGDFYVLGQSGRNEVQLVGFSGGISTGGEFTLSFEGQTTAPIVVPSSGQPTDANVQAVQAALEALPAIGAGNVRVRPFSAGHRVIFIRDLGGRDVPQMSASGGSPPVTASTNNHGSAGAVWRLDPGGALVETLDDGLGDLPQALTVDAAGNLYVGDAGIPYHFQKYDPTGVQVSQFGAGEEPSNPGAITLGPFGNALAVDEASGTLYVAGAFSAEDKGVVQAFEIPAPGPLAEGLRATDVLPTTATLVASLNPEGAQTDYRFEYVSEADYEKDVEEGGDGFEGPGTESTPEETLAGTGFDPEEVSADVGGLIPSTDYRLRMVAENEDGQISEETSFATLPAVGIEAQWASDIAATTARLNAELDPLGAEGAKWWVEYGEAKAFDEQTAKVPLTTSGPVSVTLTGLEPGTTYGYRFAAEGAHDGETYLLSGPERSFTTEVGGLGFQLPDSRAWEMVSPPNKAGGRIGAPESAQGGHVQAAEGGDALAYLSLGSVVEDPEGNRLVEASSTLARRASGGLWSSEDLTPPHTSVTPFILGSGTEYKLLSSELGRALLEPRDCTALSGAATERTPYLRQNTQPPAYTPLATAANVDPGSPPFGGDCRQINGAVSVQGASADLGHVVVRSSVPLAEGAAGLGLYEWTGGALEAISLLPGGEAAVSGELGSGAASVHNAVSADGSRVFWTASGGGLYVRDTTLDQTARLDVVQPGGFGIGAVSPRFLGASAEGSVAFFTDTRQLTADSGEDGRDLYRCEVSVEAGELGCDLANLSGEASVLVQPGESAEVQGLAPGMSEDAGRIYLVAHGVLDEAPNGEGQSAVRGEPNLYVWRAGEGMRFVAGLAEADDLVWGAPGSGTFGAAQVIAAASPSGRYLAFMSADELTGYDNRDATSGERAQEVFRYDAATEELICASCNPSGARPRALVAGGAGPLAPEFDPQLLWSGKSVAAVLPEATAISAAPSSLYRPRAMHDNGRLFFNAADALVAADSNGNGDVYQYEPLGTGSCDASSAGAATALAEGGCVSLISSGTAEGTAAFLDASVGGSDAFFYTPAPLAISDEDSVLDVYDARVGGLAARPDERVECLGEACQPPAIVPESPTPASAAFQGPGNLRSAPPRGRCARAASHAQRISRRAKRLRRATNGGARRLSRAARRQSAAAKRCRRRARSDR